MNRLAYDTKTTLEAELKFIPAPAWAVAGVVLLAWFVWLVPFVLEKAREKPDAPPLWFLSGLLTFAGVILGLWVVMIFYVNADADRRQMNRLLWTLLVIFIPNAIGFLVYFLLRQPIGQPCGKCRTLLRPEFAFCIACGHSVTSACPACHRGVESDWANCAFCGARLGG